MKFIRAVTTNIMCQLPVDVFTKVCDRNQERRSPLRRVEQAQIHSREFRPKHVGAGRGKEGENLAPSQENESSEQHEGHRNFIPVCTATSVVSGIGRGSKVMRKVTVEAEPGANPSYR